MQLLYFEIKIIINLSIKYTAQNALLFIKNVSLWNSEDISVRRDGYVCVEIQWVSEHSLTVPTGRDLLRLEHTHA